MESNIPLLTSFSRWFSCICQVMHACCTFSVASSSHCKMRCPHVPNIWWNFSCAFIRSCWRMSVINASDKFAIASHWHWKDLLFNTWQKNYSPFKIQNEERYIGSVIPTNTKNDCGYEQRNVNLISVIKHIRSATFPSMLEPSPQGLKKYSMIGWFSVKNDTTACSFLTFSLFN